MLELEAERVVEGRMPRRVTERGLHPGGELSGRVRGACRELDGPVEELGVGDALPGQAGGRGPLTVEPLAEEVHRRGGLGADGPVEQPGVATAGVDPDAQEPGVEARAGAGDAHVAREREVEAGAHRGPVHRGDRGQPALEDAQEPGVDLAHVVRVLALGAERRERGDVRARAERGRRARDHERADGVVGLELGDGRGERVDHLLAQRVAPLRVVEGEHRDPAFFTFTFPRDVNAWPVLPFLVGSTQSNISMPRETASTKSSGVPTPIK